MQFRGITNGWLSSGETSVTFPVKRVGDTAAFADWIDDNIDRLIKESYQSFKKGQGIYHTFPPTPQGVDPAKAGLWSDPNLPIRIYAHAETDEADVRGRFRTNHAQTPQRQKSKKE